MHKIIYMKIVKLIKKALIILFNVINILII